MKKMLVLLLALLALTTAACAEEFVFDLTEANTYGVIGYNGPGGDVVIPATYEGKPVTYIGPGAFEFNDQITTVVLPEGMDMIGYEAFLHCSGLTSVTLPSSMESIEERAFADCAALTEVGPLGSVDFIGEDAFTGCDRLALSDADRAAYENNGEMRTVSGETVELGGFLGGSLEELKNLVGDMKMTPESWGAYEGAVYMNDTVLTYTLDDETVEGVAVIGVSNYTVMGVGCDMTVDEVTAALAAQGYSIAEKMDFYVEYSNGNDNERVVLSVYNGKISRIDLGWTA